MTTPPSRLEEIESRLKAATPGPWLLEYENADERSGGEWYTAGPARIMFPYSANQQQETMAQINAELIAHCPEDLTYLIARVRELEDALRFYAYASHYGVSGEPYTNTLIYNDCGEIARKALTGQKGE